MKTVKTPKGTELPLVQLKGKDYLQVAHRLIWFNEEAIRFDINTSLLLCNDEQTVAHAKITMYDQNGVVYKSASATKRETKKDFSDHTEKAETGAIGRALAELGFGTQFALADLDEGSRIVDAPVADVKAATRVVEEKKSVTTSTDTTAAAPVTATVSDISENKPKTTFRRPTRPATAVGDNSGF